MARYEIGAIYEIEAGEKSYYARLLNCDVYGIFEPITGELSEKVFENTPYRLYISTGSYAVKRGFWEKLFPSPDKTDIERWACPEHLVVFTPWDIEGALSRLNSFDRYGHTEILDKKTYIECLKQGSISIIQPMYEKIPQFLNNYYDDWPESEIYSDVLIGGGTEEHRQKQISNLKKMGFDVAKYKIDRG
ncbi:MULTISPECIES: hypothetical protein [unclassified Treponema]|uniref:hypothetical protein n=1 Tax=unclassified Treponema TaxID=2638727 RepID=UPI0020A527F5|nr:MULTISPECIES: hypothetical protein [unclassified Treponema]UTC66590.1 hypothetical protein E4O06_11615 [Treponema sp. OMZ 789]UTC69323.1 hypothetical protein E4O01_11755 [Treponema sp. OMZ 790]UTC72037.1 hypothetical protein E4O02_11850 [Treponema sp. OMZ 791]